MFDVQSQLAQLEQDGLTRRRRVVQSPQGAQLVVDGKRYLAFCSNDYLGLANHPALIAAAQQGAGRWGVGAGASHLICGHTQAHEELESALADFVGLPRALYFSSGYMANLGAIPALVGRDDSVFSDQLNHACLIDACLLSRAQSRRYRHGNLAQLEQMLASNQSPRKLIVSDAIFSMDGDIAPLPQLLALCEQYDAWLLIDDAHGFGVLGAQGRGSLSHFNLSSPRLIYMGTLGKAAGVSGAFIAGAEEVIEWLVQRARTYLFSTATPPMLATALTASLKLIEAGDWRRAHLRALITHLRAGLRDSPWQLAPSETPIQPLMVGDNNAALELSAALRARGIWVPAIRPPTVPRGSARLRISLSAAHTAADVDALLRALGELVQSASSKQQWDADNHG